MAEIIEFKPRGPQMSEPDGSYQVTVNLKGTECISGSVDAEMIGDADDIMRVADDLEQLAAWLREQTYRVDGDDDRYLLARAKIYASGRAQLWVAGEIDRGGTPSREWLRERLDDAKTIV